MRLTGRVKEIRLYYEVLTCLVGNETYNKLLSFRPYLIYKVVEGFCYKTLKIKNRTAVHISFNVYADQFTKECTHKKCIV